MPTTRALFLIVALLLDPVRLAAEAAPAASVIAPNEGVLVDTARVSGSLVPAKRALVFAGQEGLRITEILVEEGDRVETGQLLARLESEMLATEYAAAVAAVAGADADLANARQDLVAAGINVELALDEAQRAERLHATGVITDDTRNGKVAEARRSEAAVRSAESAIGSAEAQYAIATADLEAANVALRQTEVRAPLAGIIIARQAQLGAVADLLFDIAVSGEIELDGAAFQDAFARIGSGMPASVTIPGLAPIKGYVVRRSGQLDPLTRMGRVRVALGDDTDAVIGMFAHAAVTLETVEGLLLPASAVRNGEVWRVEAGRVERYPIEPFREIDGYVSVSGLTPSDRVMLNFDSLVSEGQLITPLETNWTATGSTILLSRYTEQVQ